LEGFFLKGRFLKENEALVKSLFIPALPDNFGAFPALLNKLAIIPTLPDNLPVAALN
jgi:hypothetical protein